MKEIETRNNADEVDEDDFGWTLEKCDVALGGDPLYAAFYKRKVFWQENSTCKALFPVILQFEREHLAKEYSSLLVKKDNSFSMISLSGCENLQEKGVPPARQVT